MVIRNKRRLQEELRGRRDCKLVVVEDKLREGVVEMTAKCYRHAYMSGMTHHLFLQDDVFVCKNFVDSVLSLIDALPERSALSLWTGAAQADVCKRRGQHWLRGYGLSGNLAFVTRSEESLALAQWISAAHYQLSQIPPKGLKKGFGAKHAEDDLRDLYLRSSGVPTYVALPCLVTHGAGGGVLHDSHFATTERSNSFPFRWESWATGDAEDVIEELLSSVGEVCDVTYNPYLDKIKQAIHWKLQGILAQAEEVAAKNG